MSVMCVSGSTLCRYSSRKGDFPALSCASVCRVLRGSVSSDLCISGVGDCVILFCVSDLRYVLTKCVCMWVLSDSLLDDCCCCVAMLNV